MLGPSGCGKTTTLKMIAGFEQPTSGRVLLEGVDVSRVPPYKRNVNTVFQQYALFPHMTVADNVAFGPRSKRVSRSECDRRVGEMLDVVRLAEFANAQAVAAVRRPAAARRPRPRARQPPERAAARRAAGRPRPQAPRGDAARAQADPARGRDHVRVRHPRPGRGADDERPHRRDERRASSSRSARRRRSTTARRRCSSPGSSARRTCCPGRRPVSDGDDVVVELECGPTVRAITGDGNRERRPGLGDDPPGAPAGQPSARRLRRAQHRGRRPRADLPGCLRPAAAGARRRHRRSSPTSIPTTISRSCVPALPCTPPGTPAPRSSSPAGRASRRQ